MKDQSVETILALDQLKKTLLKEGDVCSYELLKIAISRDPQGDGRGYVASARRQFERLKECVLGVIENEGIKWLPPREIINLGARYRRHISRTAKRSFSALTTIVNRQAEMGPEEQKQYLTESSMAATLNHMSRPAARKKIAAAVETAPRLLATAETLALFQSKKSGAEQIQ